MVRGLLDGDGSVYTKIHRPTVRTYPKYTYERLWTFFASASRPHLEWLRDRLADAVGVSGYIETRKATSARRAFFRLKYGNGASIVPLSALYADPSAPRLERKWQKWASYLDRHPPTRLGPLPPYN